MFGAFGYRTDAGGKDQTNNKHMCTIVPGMGNLHGSRSLSRPARSARSLISTCLLAGGVLLGSGSGDFSRATAGSFPTSPMDDQQQFSIAVLRILIASKFQPMFDGTYGSPYYGYSSASGRFTSPLLFDSQTWIGMSAAHCEQVSSASSLWPAGPGMWPANPGVVCSSIAPFNSGGSTPATASYSEFTGTPFGFGSPGTGYNEVFTYMINLQLKSQTNCYDPSIPQTPPAYDMVNPMVFTGPQNYPSIHKSIGRMISATAPGCLGTTPTPGYTDFASGSPANSFFDMYVNAYIPPGPGTDVPAGLYLYNDPADPNLGPQPLIIENSDVESLPPVPLYIHGGSLYAVPIKTISSGQDVSHNITWGPNEIVGMVTLAGHQLGLTCGQGPLAKKFVDDTLGKARTANPEAAPLWVFPPPGLYPAGGSYRTVAGTNVGGGSVDEVTFTVPGLGSVYCRSFVHTVPNPINRPSTGNSATYATPASSVTFELSLNDTDFSTAFGSGPMSLSISNMGTSGNATLYATRILGFTNICTGPFGTVLLRSSLTKDSIGQDTVIPSPQGPYIASIVGVNYELSTDAGNTWVPPDRSIQWGVGEPACGVPGNQLSVQVSGGFITLTWSGPNYTLQGSPNVTGPWTNIAGTSPVVLAQGVPWNFFRTSCPP